MFFMCVERKNTYASLVYVAWDEAKFIYIYKFI